MPFRTLIDQLNQISGSRTYDDTKTMANAESVHNRLEHDLNYIRTQLKLITGETNWYDAPSSDITSIDLDFVCDNGATTDQAIIIQGSGSVFDSLMIDDDLQVVDDVWIGDDLIVGGNATVVGDITGDKIYGLASGSTFNTLTVTDSMRVNSEYYGPDYSSNNHILNTDGLVAAIGKLDVAVSVADVDKAVERLVAQVNSGSSHTVPDSETYTPDTGGNMDVYMNGQLLNCSLEDEERDYTEVAGADSTTIKFTFNVPADTYLTYLIRS